MDTKKAADILKTSVLILALIAFIVVAACQFYEAKSNENDSERVLLGYDGGKSELIGSSLMGRPAPMGDIVGIVASGSFMIVDKNASSVSTDTYMLSDPVLDSDGKYCVVGDYGGKTVHLYEDGKLLTEIEAEGTIISLVTNTNGFFAVATEQVGYDAVVTVYRKNGEAVYRYRMSGKSFIDMDISENNRRLLIAAANLDYGTVATTLTVAEFNREDAESVFEATDKLYFAVHFNKNGSFVCLGESGVDIYRADGEKQSEIDFSSRTLTAADISTDDMICLAFSTSSGELVGAVMEIYDKNGKKRGETQFSQRVEYICVNGAYAAASYGNYVDIVRGNGKVKTKLEAQSPVKYAAPFSNGSSAVVFAGGNTEVLKG
jgi:hypothetical protein